MHQVIRQVLHQVIHQVKHPVMHQVIDQVTSSHRYIIICRLKNLEEEAEAERYSNSKSE